MIAYFIVFLYWWLPLLIISVASKNKKGVNVLTLLYVITIFSILALLGSHFIERLLKPIDHIIYVCPDRTYYSLASVFRHVICYGFQPVKPLLPLFILSIMLIHLKKRFLMLSSFLALAYSLFIIGYLCLISPIEKTLDLLEIWMPMSLWIIWVLVSFLREAHRIQPIVQQYSNAQAPWRLALLSIVTFGIYKIYWFYRNWKHLKIHRSLDISPGWRTVGLFVPIYNIVLIYRQVRDIRDFANQSGFETYSSPGWLTFAYIFLSGILFRLAIYKWKLTDSEEFSGLTILRLLIDLLSIWLLVVVQKTLNRFWKKEQPELGMKSTFSAREIVLLVTGGFFWYLSLIGISIPKY